MEHGKVTSVNYKDGVVYCDVKAIRLSSEYTNVPVLKSHSGFIEMPKQGMKVAIDKLKDGTRFIQGVIGKESATPSTMREGEIALQLDKQTKVTLKEAGDNYDVSIEASGDVNINAGGDVIIDGIPFGSHTHGYTWDNDGGSGTTDGPN